MHCLYGGYNLHQFSDALGLAIDLNFVGDFWKINTLLKYIVKTTVKFSS